ncbi:hypothetical protein ASPWEDRAFT_175598 [Aspergillus wentii DTO 134E9]|uniref:C2H2-type domain-containing protein n=1 Tax=Aspergillus wentii DTO 134E9 TaxID=1073089 RepID=A0A1L9RBR3_ASPWE|nr:uncharacterized protein ASPWEDRAFT_175598 [Aspergillus wentii DTO 134E9]KAI9934873.1 hypothetical protein MW887_000493 [Aspergillus wentii]OJJ32313.1 hypothetical protein ASPWEDRAFT_175598 [Aspergillus wentii DTO 134E9]
MASIMAVPSLSSDSPSSSSTSSVDTRIASELGLAAQNMLEDDGTGLLIVPSSSTHHLHHQQRQLAQLQLHHQNDYPCLFHLLNCHKTFTNAEHWKTHVLSHFRTHAPPKTARCPLCPKPFTTSSNSSARTAWDAMLDHLDVAHYQHGQTLAGSRPDFELMRYLFQMRIISEDQFKVLQLSPARGSPGYHRSQDTVRARVGSSDEPFCAPYSRRREERRRGQRRGIGVL